MVKCDECIPARVTIAICLLTTFFCMLMIRNNLTMAMLAMANSNVTFNHHNQLPNYGPRYNWNVNDQNHLVGAFFLGFSASACPMGVLIDRYGRPKAHLQFIFCFCLLVTVLSPFAANSFNALLLLRLFMGVATGGLPGATQKLISVWSPPKEKGRFLSTFFGTDLGNIFTWMMCGELIVHAGWKYAFYVPAILLALFFVIFSLLVYDSPDVHPRINPDERYYIEHSLIGIDPDHKGWPPLWTILTSMPFYSLLLLNYGHSWGQYFLSTGAPKFMNQVLGYKLEESGFLASLPFIVRFVTGIGFGALSDYTKTNDLNSELCARKLACILSHIFPGLFLLGIPIIGDQPTWCIAFLTLSYGFNGAIVMTSFQNLHELAPNYTSTIISIISTFSLTSGYMAPILVTALAGQQNNIRDWSNVFTIGAVVYIFPAIWFMLFGSVEIQEWNTPSRVSVPIELARPEPLAGSVTRLNYPTVQTPLKKR